MEEHFLVGKWFHSFAHDKVKNQGQIISKKDDYVLVQLYSWMLGEASCQKLFPVESIVEWDLYDTAEEMRDVFEVFHKR